MLRWADSPYQSSLKITTSTPNLALAVSAADANREPIGHLHLGPPGLIRSHAELSA